MNEICAICGGPGANSYRSWVNRPGEWAHSNFEDCVNHLKARAEAAEAVIYPFQHYNGPAADVENMCWRCGAEIKPSDKSENGDRTHSDPIICMFVYMRRLAATEAERDDLRESLLLALGLGMDDLPKMAGMEDTVIKTTIQAWRRMLDEGAAERDALRAQLAELVGRPEYPPTGEPPAELWLQWYGDDDENYLDTEYGYGVTWSQDKVFARDVRYRIAPPQEAVQ